MGSGGAKDEGGVGVVTSSLSLAKSLKKKTGSLVAIRSFRLDPQFTGDRNRSVFHVYDIDLADRCLWYVILTLGQDGNIV